MPRMPSPEELEEDYGCFGHFGYEPDVCRTCPYAEACHTLLSHVQRQLHHRSKEPSQRRRTYVDPYANPAQERPTQEGGVHYHYHYYGHPPAHPPHAPTHFPAFTPPPNPILYEHPGQREQHIAALAEAFLAEALRRLTNRR